MVGFTALEAKIKANAPCDTSNISKRGRALVKAGVPRVARPHKGPASLKPKKLKCAYRLKPGQVEQLSKQREALKRNTTDAFKKVTEEVLEAAGAKAAGKKRDSIGTMVAAANATLPPGAPKIAASSVAEAVRNGHAGKSPKKKGPQSVVPEVITDAAGSWARVGQVSGDEKTNTRLGQHMVAAVMGTDTEGTFTERGAKEALKKRKHLTTTASSSQDERRYLWTTYDNLTLWFGGWKEFLVTNLFGTPDDDSSRAPRQHGRALRRHEGTR